MPLYHWPYVEVLKAYRRGDIFVEADSVEEAREIVLRDFDAWLKDRFDFYFYDGKPWEHCEENVAAKWEALRHDLEIEPRVITKGAVFVEGSE